MALGLAVVAPYQVDWYVLTHPFDENVNTPGLSEALSGLIFIFAIPAYATVGAVVATLRPKNAIGWLCIALSLLVVLVGMPLGVSALGIPWYVVDWIRALAWNLMVPPLPVTLMLLVFPEGRLLSRRWWVVVGIALVGYALTVLEVFLPYSLGAYTALGSLGEVGTWTSVAALVASVAAVVLRWRRSRDQERQQIKWLVYMVALMVVAGLGVVASGYLWGAFSYIKVFATAALVAGVGLGIPAAIGVAVLRYRLYEIDLLINRTLVYGSLTTALVAVYLGAVVLLQSLFRALTDQGSQLAVVASTLAIAALFNPLRRRIQGFIDRSFYRRKYDAVKTLEAFSAKLRDETDLDALSDDLVGVVSETLQPAHVSLWLRPQEEKE